MMAMPMMVVMPETMINGDGKDKENDGKDLGPICLIVFVLTLTIEQW